MPPDQHDLPTTLPSAGNADRQVSYDEAGRVKPPNRHGPVKKNRAKGLYLQKVLLHCYQPSPSGG